MTYCMTMYLNQYQKYNRSNQKCLNLLIYDTPVQGHKVPHWIALRYVKNDLRGLTCDSTLNINQDVLKSANSLHKQGFC